jgi:choline monooxygenase
VPSDFVYEGDLARATTLPADWYLGEESLARDQRRIFGRTWQLVGHAAAMARCARCRTCAVTGPAP